MRLMIGVVLAGVMMAGMVQAQQAAAPMPGQISVMGEAVIAATPDMATVSLGVTTQGAAAGGAMRSNSDALAAVMDRLRGAGIEARDLQTSNLSLNPNWTQTDGTTTPVISGYTASNMLSVRVRDLAILGTVLDAVITDGANTLNGIAFEQSDPRPATDAARKSAVADALAKATLIADAAGVKLGRILSISENIGYSSPMPMMKSMAMDAASVPVAAGEIGVSASVNMVFELAQ